MLFESVFLDIFRLLPSQKLRREKNQVRELLAQKRRILTKDMVQQLSAEVLAHLEQLPAFQSAQTVLIYYPTHNEVDVLPLIKRYKKEKTFLFPVVHRRSMTACPYEGNAKMHRGKFNIPEPTTEPYIGKIDLIILPGVGFDLCGNRLGRGGGYYDRYLANIKRGTVLVGVGYDFQLIEEVPAARHDKRLGYIVTNRGITKAKMD
ncbi:MAG: 5-formyltetrahydrofolate cyclo-ligase [Paludibacteraceae bacterium]|nr:5-formyltetrahydrofolate cyclo-ligase [Paludibacteraceae bacterium]